MPRVTFLHPEGKSGEVEANSTLLEAAQVLGFPLNHDCGGNASCTTCRVEVQIGGEDLSEIDAVSKPAVIYPNWMFGFQQADRLPGATRDFSAAMKPTV